VAGDHGQSDGHGADDPARRVAEQGDQERGEEGGPDGSDRDDAGEGDRGDRRQQRSIEAARGAPFPERGLTLSPQRPRPRPADFRTLQIDAGRQDKLRPGDVLGALTGAAGLPADAVGKISLHPTRCYVAVARAHADHALATLRAQGIKGRKLRVKPVG